MISWDEISTHLFCFHGKWSKLSNILKSSMWNQRLLIIYGLWRHRVGKPQKLMMFVITMKFAGATIMLLQWNLCGTHWLFSLFLLCLACTFAVPLISFSQLSLQFANSYTPIHLRICMCMLIWSNVVLVCSIHWLSLHELNITSTLLFQSLQFAM
jgi:hypothetical protein